MKREIRSEREMKERGKRREARRSAEKSGEERRRAEKSGEARRREKWEEDTIRVTNGTSPNSETFANSFCTHSVPRAFGSSSTCGKAYNNITLSGVYFMKRFFLSEFVSTEWIICLTCKSFALKECTHFFVFVFNVQNFTSCSKMKKTL
jgi:hypothetical protein